MNLPILYSLPHSALHILKQLWKSVSDDKYERRTLLIAQAVYIYYMLLRKRSSLPKLLKSSLVIDVHLCLVKLSYADRMNEPAYFVSLHVLYNQLL